MRNILRLFTGWSLFLLCIYIAILYTNIFKGFQLNYEYDYVCIYFNE